MGNSSGNDSSHPPGEQGGLELIRRNIAIVLVRARNPANIGAVARAMHDFGFGSLRVVQ